MAEAVINPDDWCIQCGYRFNDPRGRTCRECRIIVQLLVKAGENRDEGEDA